MLTLSTFQPMPPVSRCKKARPRPMEAPRRSRSGSQPTSVTDGDVNTFILVIALLVGHIGDQFLVDATLDIGQIDCLHGS